MNFIKLTIYLLLSLFHSLASVSEKEKNISPQSKKCRKEIWIGATAVAGGCIAGLVYIFTSKSRQVNSTKTSSQFSVTSENIIACKNFKWGDIDQKKPIILLTTGSYRVPHPGHILPMAALRRFLIQKSYKNVALIFSPSHNDWFQHKRKKGTVHEHINPSWEQRKYLLEVLMNSLAARRHISQEEREFMSITDIESKGNVIDYPIVYQKISEEFKEKTVIYCSGQDLWDNHTTCNALSCSF
ncbi:MAG: hypothetical protein AAF380_02080 [Bacteroidota bacterium]